MLPVAPGHAVNLKNVAYIQVDGKANTATICTVDGKKQVKKEARSVDYERAFSQARISILLYSTAGGDQTVISMDHLIEIVDDQTKGIVTYRLRGDYLLEIAGGGPFPNHVKMANTAVSEYQRMEAPIEATASASALGSTTTKTARANSAIDAKIASEMQFGPVACNFCGVAGADKRCAGCKSVYYCSGGHQAQDWEARHQRECNPLSK